MLCVLTDNLYKWDKWSSVRAQLKKWRKLNHRGRAAFKRHAWRRRCHGEPDDCGKSHKSYSRLIEFGSDKALIEHPPPHTHTSLKFGGRSAIAHPNDIWPAVLSMFRLHASSDSFFFFKDKMDLFNRQRALYCFGVWDVTSPQSIRRTEGAPLPTPTHPNPYT